MTTMRAAVLNRPGDITLSEVPVPRPTADEALVKVAACGVCGSDLARMLHKGTYRFPLICGHEFSGHVVETGADVHEARVGDLVSVPPMIPCFRCDQCQRGRFSLCEDYDYFGSRRDGAYAEYVCVPKSNLFVMPEGLDPRAAAMIDPAAIALHALRRTKLGIDQHVCVVGAGPIGLFAVQWARLGGAATVVAVDLNEEKARMALEAGADHAVSDGEEARAFAPDGYDVVLESAGASAAVDLAVSLAARHGDVTFVGIPNSPVTLQEATFNRFLRFEVSLHGAWNSFSAPFPGEEWTSATRFLARGDLKWEFMITHEAGLDQVGTLIPAMGDRSIFSSKVLFLPRSDDD
ncbi:MAG: alcohol dehydrogenase catalytic domain-containing protein [Streptosporangiales bacterium]|nr:alcohol dehydrogenase catalytic domain-containing protein [Streptosporangiales bacterium]